MLIPAAGEGTRMGGTRKQFRSLGGKSLLVRTLSVFQRHDEVETIVVAAPAEAVDPLQHEFAAEGLTKAQAVVPGGATRQASVEAALMATPATCTVLLVHDAVRPFVRAGHISAVIAAVRQHGAAALAVPVADTMRRGYGGRFAETVPREQLFAMQTPQGFQRGIFESAHARPSAPTTDDVALVQRLGYPVWIVEGSPRNFKVTTPDDWALAQMLWAEVQQTEAQNDYQAGSASKRSPTPTAAKRGV
ncbi:MAG: 2-C-methyl-D-erythritol 4-phosphate cytidylyltransferase [Bacteroidota bacterium]